MKPHLDQPFRRRDFFMAAARSAVLAVMAGFAVWQEAKRRRLENDPNCIRLSVCADCVEFGRCTKPKATATRV